MAEPSVRVFVSSPSDLEHERALIKDIIRTLAREYAPYFELQAVLWEEEALTAAQSFQAGLAQPAECEIVLVMLWTRLGTPLAQNPYHGMTGTEWEFVNAVEASAHSNGPQVLVYQKTAPRLVDITNAEAVQTAVAARERLERFFREHFYNADGSFRRAFRQFERDSVLRDLVETQLRKLLNRRISAERRFASDFADWRASPFRPERHYGSGDERIFTGREAEVRELIARLDALRQRPGGALLISGPSGAGKSSLIHAGLIPHLKRPALFGGISTCRLALLGPDHEKSVGALAQALYADGALGAQLEAAGIDSSRLARLLKGDPQVGAEQIQAAAHRATQEEQRQSGELSGTVQLAIIVDPLWATADPDLTTLPHVLKALAEQPGIWVVATLRETCLPLLAEHPQLATLFDEQAHMALAPLPATRIRQIVEIPTRVAGVEIEDRSQGGVNLLERLEADVGTLRHWAPLLEGALERLYRQQPETTHAAAVRQLTLADYRATGGLAGAVLARAERLWDALDTHTRAALPRLCRALIAIDDSEQPSARPRAADLAIVRRDPTAAALLDALIAERLVACELTSEDVNAGRCRAPDDEDGRFLRRLLGQIREEWRARLSFTRRRAVTTGTLGRQPAAPPEPAMPNGNADPRQRLQHWQKRRAVCILTHPALAHQWQPLRDWQAVPAHRDDLLLRQQISRQAALWQRTDCNREYLLGETGYAAARNFAQRYDDELEPDEQQLLAHSWRQLRRQRRRNRRTIGATLATLLVFAAITLYTLWNAAHRAEIMHQRTQLGEAAAAIARSDTPQALSLALDAYDNLPHAATMALARTLVGNRLLAALPPADADSSQLSPPAFSADGNWLATLTDTHGARLWQRQGRRYLAQTQLATPALPIQRVLVIEPASGTPTATTNPPKVIGLGSTGVWRLPASASITDTTAPPPPDWNCGNGAGERFALGPHGRYLALSFRDGSQAGICLLDLTRPGAPLWRRTLHVDAIRSIAFSADGTRLLSGSRDGTSRLIDRDSGEQLTRIPREGPPGRPVNRTIFSPDGQRIAIAAWDEQIRIYDTDGRQQMALGSIRRGARDVKIHQSSVRALAFSPDGTSLVAGDGNGQVVRWDLAERSATVLGRHDLSVYKVAVAPHADPVLGETTVLSVSQDRTARLWRLETGEDLAVLTQPSAITNAEFSRDGARVMTASQRDGAARLWSVGTNNLLATQLPAREHVGAIALANAPDTPPTGNSGLLLASGADDGRVQLWRIAPDAAAPEPRLLFTQTVHRSRVSALALSPDGQWLASAGADGSVRRWDLHGWQTGTDEAPAHCTIRVAQAPDTCARIGAADCPEVHRVLFTPDGQWLLTASSDVEQPVRIWHLADCREVTPEHVFTPLFGGVRAVATRSNEDGGLLFAVGDGAGQVQIIRRDPRGLWSTPCAQAGHWSAINAIAFSPDGRWLAAASRDGRASLSALSGGRCSEPLYLKPEAGGLFDLAFAPDNQTLVTAAFDAEAQVWALGTHYNPERPPQLIARLGGHNNRLVNTAFSPDSNWIMTAAADGVIDLWRRPRQIGRQRIQQLAPRPFLTLDPGLGGIAQARFSADGQRIAVAYRGYSALLWQIWDRLPDMAGKPFESRDGDGWWPPRWLAADARARIDLTLLRRARNLEADESGPRNPAASPTVETRQSDSAED